MTKKTVEPIDAQRSHRIDTNKEDFTDYHITLLDDIHISGFLWSGQAHYGKQCIFLQKGISFPHVMSRPLYLDVDTCWSKAFRGAAVMDRLVAMEEHRLIGCGDYHTVYWRHGLFRLM